MTTSEHKYLSDFARKYYGDGEASGETKGKRAALLAVVDARGLVTPPAIRARIDACGDVALLDRWIARAATAVSIDEIVGEPAT